MEILEIFKTVLTTQLDNFVNSPFFFIAIGGAFIFFILQTIINVELDR